MKIALTLILAAGAFISGCANDPAAATQNDNRIGGRMGVSVGSRDMSRVTPEHASPAPPGS
ncbi:MAG TPA: hypothetical protein VGM54_24400 [Chthoniobacter sp.]|jgi:hypothetical protein